MSADLVKRLRAYGVPKIRCEAADRIEQLEQQQRIDHENINLKADVIDRWINTSAEQHQHIEQLERELAEAREVVRKQGRDLGTLDAELTAEKALADRLARSWTRFGFEPGAWEAYRKARGL